MSHERTADMTSACPDTTTKSARRYVSPRTRPLTAEEARIRAQGPRPGGQAAAARAARNAEAPASPEGCRRA
jgi:hypothetical protein